MRSVRPTVSDLQQALLPLIIECKLTRTNTTSIYRYTIVLSYICALIRSCIRSHTVVMLSGARRPCVHLGCVTPAARCKFYLQLPLGSSILSYHCERLTRQFGIVTQNSDRNGAESKFWRGCSAQPRAGDLARTPVKRRASSRSMKGKFSEPG